MRAFRLTADQAVLFFEICAEIHADTEEKRLVVLSEMAKVGAVDGITDTKMSKEEYVKHLSSKFGKVLVVKSKETPPNA
jgi:hypothetical protein